MVRARLDRALHADRRSPISTGGPARYVRVTETGGRLGFITPLTHNFCESCNRVRLTCTGTLYMCLGQEDAADLRAPLRASESNDLLNAAIDDAIARKPKGHDFVDRAPRAAPGGRTPHERHRRMIARALMLCALLMAVPIAAQAQGKTQEKWTTYRNDRFGTTIEYPARFKPGRPPDNNDGLAFTAADGATLRVWGSLNIEELDREALEKQTRERQAGNEIYSYSARGPNWFVFSGRRGPDAIFCMRYAPVASRRGHQRDSTSAIRRPPRPLTTRLSRAFRKSLRPGRGFRGQGNSQS